MLTVVGLLIFASPALAQMDTTQQDTAATVAPKPEKAPRFEIIPMGGYVWTTSQSATYTNVGGDVDLKNSNFYGIALDINVMPVMQFRLLYRRQNTEATFKRVGGTDNLGDIAVEYWHVGVVKAVKKTEKAMPFTSFTLGGTRYVGDNRDDWKFSVILGLGAKVYLNDRLGLMVTGQLPFTFTNTFLGIGTGGVSLGGSGVVQLDVAAGVMISI
jgi:hypothetical protein